MNHNRVGVIGATSLVGDFVLAQLVESGHEVLAFSRKPHPEPAKGGIEWRRLDLSAQSGDGDQVSDWIFLAPFWVLPQYFAFLEAHGVRRLVALSSTSRFTKQASSDSGEQALARVLEEGERVLSSWAEQSGIEWVVLRPTMIYGRGRDRNVMEIARFIKRFGFFPLFGAGGGKRQPVHAADVASACVAGLVSPQVQRRAYDISGAEVLSYREMVERIFLAMGRKPRLFKLPLWMFRAGVACLRCLPRYRTLTSAMAERMQLDMAFSHDDATRDFGYSPRPLHLAEDDLPI